MNALPPTPSGSPGRGSRDPRCEAFAEAALLAVDRELGPAERAALEAHLAACAACRSTARRAELLTMVLRRWDAERVGPVRAPDRLRTAVLTTLGEAGHWRRLEWRRTRRAKLALAASVVLALGGGLLVGLASGPAGGPAVTTARVAEAPPAEPLAGVLPERPPVRPAEPRVRARPLPLRLDRLVVAAPDPSARLDETESTNVGTFLGEWKARREMRLLFEEAAGDAVWWTDPVAGEERLVSVRVLTYLRDVRGAESVSDFIASLGRGRTLPAPSAAAPPVVVDTGRRIADYLGVPATRRGLESVMTAAALARVKDGVAVHAIPATSGRAARRAPLRVADLSEAVAAGQVTLGEGREDHLVAVVRGTERPVFLPAGELIGGGRVDRLVQRGTWLPATQTEVRIEIPCVPAGTPRASAGGRPTPTGMIAGPAVRGLLARGASARSVRAWLAEKVPYGEDWGGDYTLLAFHDSSRLDMEGLRRLERELLGSGARGFVVTSVDGAFLGVEVTDLPPESAAPLLGRLVLGYLAEGAMEEMARRLHGDDESLHAESIDPLFALRSLLAHPETLRARDGATSGIQLARGIEPRTRIAVEVVEQTSSGRVVLASALAP